jgi:hypothetical protein
MALDLGKFNAEVKARATSDPLFARIGLMFEQTEDAVNQVASSLGVDASGHTSPPDPPTTINVKAAGGIAHVTITDNSQRSRALNYFVEHSTDPSFAQPHVAHLGASRGTFLNLPALNDGGDAQPWYFRVYSMAPGSSQRSPVQTFGGTATPTPVSVGGSVQLTPLPSTGSGTASTGGQQGAQGFGTAQYSNAG